MSDFKLYGGVELTAAELDMAADRFPVRDSSAVGNDRHKWMTPTELQVALGSGNTSGLAAHLADFNNPHRSTLAGLTNSGVVYDSGANTLSAPNFSGTSYRIGANSYVTTTGNYTLGTGDNGKFILVTATAPTPVRVPTGLPPGFSCFVSSEGTGAVTITGVGTTIQGFSGYYTLFGQYTSATLWQKSANIYRLDGALR